MPETERMPEFVDVGRKRVSTETGPVLLNPGRGNIDQSAGATGSIGLRTWVVVGIVILKIHHRQEGVYDGKSTD
jgi:hypothetical protein